MSRPPAIREPEAGPSSTPGTRSASPDGRALRRPASHGRLAKLMVPGRSRSGSSASQAETPVTAFADEMPGSSGRSTPEHRWRSNKAATSLLASDAKYKKFAALVDKCLQSFESVNEWADFISFLSRLLKTLQSPQPAYTEVPRKLVVAKRLAQCLNPALPSGVHQRALDVYAHIFATIGTEGLRRDLLIWSSGIFPFFQFAATSVRPILLNIYEKYYLPLGEDLRPVTKALILALLPGMEEETGDFFDKVLSILSRVSRSVGDAFFLQNVFLTLISSPTSRLSAINLLSRKMLKPPDASGGMDIGLIIRGVGAVLEDENSLVRRGGLDLLLRILPLDGHLLREADDTDKQLLVRSTMGVVLQREISLSRRVYTWLLGSDETSESQTAYFRKNGLELLSTTLLTDMDTLDGDSADAQRPFKVFLSLLDRWEVGSVLSEKIAVQVMEAVKNAIEQSPTLKEEFLMTASAVYDAVEPIIIWRAFFEALEKEDDHLLRWTLQNLPQKDQEVTGVHLPVVLDHALTVFQSPKIDLASLLLRHIPPDMFLRSAPLGDSEDKLVSMYASDVPVESMASRVPAEAIPRIVKTTFDLTVTAQSATESLLALDMATRLVGMEAVPVGHLKGSDWLEKLVSRLGLAKTFPLVDAIVSTALIASQSTLFRPPLNLTQPRVMQTILDTLFRYLQPVYAIYHVRVVELLWEYNRLAEVHSLENVIAGQISTALGKNDTTALSAFGTIWRLTDDAMLPGEMFHVPLFLVLDSLKSADPDIREAAETWMRLNLQSYFRVLDPLLTRLIDPTGSNGDVSGQDIDYTLIVYLIRHLETLLKVEPKDMTRICQSTKITTSTHPSLVQKAGVIASESGTYLDLLVSILVTYLRDPSRIRGSDRSVLLRVQSATLSILQLLVASGDVSRPSMQYLRTALLDKLANVVASRQTSLQRQLLRLLQSSVLGHKTHQRTVSLGEKTRRSESDDFDKTLAHVIIEGVSSPATRNVLQHWVDFVLAVSSTLQSRPPLLHTLCDCFSLRIRSAVLELQHRFAGVSGSAITGMDIVTLLSGLERLIVLSGSNNNGRKSEDGRVGNEGGSGLLGYVSGVFISDAPDEKPKSHGSEYISTAIESLLVAWTVSTPQNSTGSSGSTYTQTMSSIRSNVKQVLEKMFQTQISLVVSSCIAIWKESPKHISDDSIFDCIDTLTPSAQRVAEIASDSVKQSRTDNGDQAVMGFLETYISRLEAPIAVQIWTTMFSFARDLLLTATTPTAKAQLYPLLRCLTALCKIVTTTSALEDRRLRRDLQEVYPKALDMVVSNINKVGPAFVRNMGSINGPTVEAPPTVVSYLAGEVIPHLRSFLVEPDRVAAACSSISLAVVTPALKQYKPDAEALRTMLELTKIPAAAKTWRIVLGDAFNDSRFFNISADQVGLWKPLISALMDSDKERFIELLTAPSANIFTNREQEMISRSSNLRRLSFVLLAADQNHYLTQLPAIQEKLVDILRTNVVSPRVHSEVYLCLRVLMCRISPQHLTNFWPVILAELLRVFDGIMDDVPEDGSESLQLALAACKFLDLLLVIQSEDFQVHQWMFVTDTTDAVYPPEVFAPEAIMDTLAGILREHGHGVKGEMISLALEESTKLRRPRLLRVKMISSIRQLEPFFSRGSIDTFEGVYRESGVDWVAVEDGLCGEIFG